MSDSAVVNTRESSRPAMDAAGFSRPKTLFVPSDATDVAPSSRLAVHVLAQAQGLVTASIPASHAPACRLLARAYGIEDRLEIRDENRREKRPTGAIVVDAGEVTPASLWYELADHSNHLPSDRSTTENGLLETPRRVAVVTNIPIHYRVALFNEIEAQLAAGGSSLHVIFTSPLPRDRSWIPAMDLRFDHVFLDSVDIGRARGRRMIPAGIARTLERIDPDVVLSGGFSPFVSGRVARWCNRRTRPFGVWSGEIGSRPSAGKAFRRVQRRRLLSQSDFAVAYGWESARYLDSFGLDVPVAIGRNTTPMPPFRAVTEQQPLRLLTVGRAERGKRLDLVVEAVRRLETASVTLSIVGDGPELRTLQTVAAGSDNVRLLGAMAPDRVLETYRSADVFLFPSDYDVFGLVLIEALAAGLPIVTSAAPGALPDLIVDGVNALVVREPSAGTWEAAIRELMGDASLRRRLGAEAANSVRNRWTIAHAASSMIAGFRLGLMARSERGA